MVDVRKPSGATGWLALSLLVLAVVAFVLPVARFALATSDEGVALGDGPTEVRSPGDRTWGVYVNDADNSGYSTSCIVTSPDGRTIVLRDPGVTVSSSDTEMLDYVFTTPPDGRFTIDCAVTGASVRVGPVGSFPEILIGLAIAATLGLGGVVTGSIWLSRRLTAAPPAGVDTGDPSSA